MITLLIHIFFVILMIISANLLLRSKENLGFESYSEIAYLCLGKSSVYVLNVIMIICASGIVCLYMTLFTSIAMALFRHVEVTDPTLYNLIHNKTFFVLMLSLILLPNVFKKHVNELKIASYLLIIGIIAILIAFIM